MLTGAPGNSDGNGDPWSGPIGSEVAGVNGGEPINGFGLPGQSIEAPGAYQGGQPVGGPASIFNIGGAPIALFGGVFSGGLPLGGPVTQAFRGGGPIPNTLFAIALESSGPIGEFFLGGGGAPIGLPELAEPITEEGLRVAGEPIEFGLPPGGRPISLDLETGGGPIGGQF